MSVKHKCFIVFICSFIATIGINYVQHGLVASLIITMCTFIGLAACAPIVIKIGAWMSRDEC